MQKQVLLKGRDHPPPQCGVPAGDSSGGLWADDRRGDEGLVLGGNGLCGCGRNFSHRNVWPYGRSSVRCVLAVLCKMSTMKGRLLVSY